MDHLGHLFFPWPGCSIQEQLDVVNKAIAIARDNNLRGYTDDGSAFLPEPVRLPNRAMQPPPPRRPPELALSGWAQSQLLKDALAASEFKERVQRGQPAFEPTYTQVGAHTRVYWNFTTGLFTCEDCECAMAVAREMRFIACKPRSHTHAAHDAEARRR